MESTRIGRIEIHLKMIPEINIQLVLKSRNRLAKIKRRKRVAEARKAVEIEMSCVVGFGEGCLSFWWVDDLV